MKRQRIFSIFVIGLILTGGLGWWVYHSQFESSNHSSEGPEITNFQANNTTCVKDFDQNMSIEQHTQKESTTVLIRQSVKMPNGSVTLAPEELRKDGTNYTMILGEIKQPNETPTQDGATSQNCTTQVRYTTTIRLPHSETDQFSLSIRYNDRELLSIQSDSDSSGGGGSSSGGGTNHLVQSQHGV